LGASLKALKRKPSSSEKNRNGAQKYDRRKKSGLGKREDSTNTRGCASTKRGSDKDGWSGKKGE